MKRLRDTEPGSPLAAQAKSLLEAVEPLPDDMARMQRVRRAIEATEAGGAFARSPRRWPAFGVALAVGLFGASAFAAVRFVAEWRAAATPVPAVAPAVTAAPHAPTRRAADEAVAEPVLAPQAVEPSPPETVPDESAARPRRVPNRPERGAAAETEAPTGAAAADRELASPHSALVHEALQALRHHQDPARAARLLESYAARAPEGPLAEEALSLRIEAAQALGDSRARALAGQYLQRYPSGRYVPVARAALAARP
jgi:hypothetical protein